MDITPKITRKISPKKWRKSGSWAVSEREWASGSLTHEGRNWKEAAHARSRGRNFQELWLTHSASRYFLSFSEHWIELITPQQASATTGSISKFSSKNFEKVKFLILEFGRLMFKELALQNIWESVIPVKIDSTFKIKSTLWWPGFEIAYANSPQRLG